MIDSCESDLWESDNGGSTLLEKGSGPFCGGLNLWLTPVTPGLSHSLKGFQCVGWSGFDLGSGGSVRNPYLLFHCKLRSRLSWGRGKGEEGTLARTPNNSPRSGSVPVGRDGTSGGPESRTNVLGNPGREVGGVTSDPDPDYGPRSF